MSKDDDIEDIASTAMNLIKDIKETALSGTINVSESFVMSASNAIQSIKSTIERWDGYKKYKGVRLSITRFKRSCLSLGENSRAIISDQISLINRLERAAKQIEDGALADIELEAAAHKARDELYKKYFDNEKTVEQLAVEIESLESKIRSLEARLEKSTIEMESIKDSNYQSYSNFANEIRQKSSEEMREFIQLEKNLFDEKLNKLSSRTKAAESGVNEIYNKALKSIEQSIEEIKKNSKEDLMSTIEEAKKILDEAGLIVNQAGTVALSKGHEDSSKKESRTSIGYFFVSASCLVFASLVMLSNIIDFSGILGFAASFKKADTTTNESTYIYVAAIFSLYALAAFFGRASVKHRDISKRQASIALALRTINPYVRTMTPETQESIKSTIANKIFIPDETKNPEHGTIPSVTYEAFSLLIKQINNDKNQKAEHKTESSVQSPSKPAS